MANCLLNSTSGFSLESEFTGVSYDLQHNDLLYMLLPNIYKTEKIFKYLQVMFSSLGLFWSSIFLKDREQLQTEIRITGQTMVLEAWLRVYFSNCDINIVNLLADIDLMYLYKKGESGDVADETFIYRKGEVNPNQEYLLRRDEAIPDEDFVVEIPSLVINSGVTQREIEAVVDRYRYMGTKYKIKII